MHGTYSEVKVANGPQSSFVDLIDCQYQGNLHKFRDDSRYDSKIHTVNLRTWVCIVMDVGSVGSMIRRVLTIIFV